jgi:hypothetical protein
MSCGQFQTGTRADRIRFTIRGIMATAQKRKPRKRGPKEERLVIRDDPAAALARLLLKPSKVASLKAAFAAVHKNGMEAIRRGDYDAFGKAVDRERKILDDLDTTINPAPKRRK